ncbi:MAG: hypothetical protein AAGG75_24605 [Bacteroidota bacterium]
MENENTKEKKSSNFWKYYLGCVLLGIVFILNLPGSYSAHGYSGGADPTVLIVTFIIAIFVIPLIALIVGWVKKNYALMRQAGIFALLYLWIVLLLVAAFQ